MSKVIKTTIVDTSKTNVQPSARSTLFQPDFVPIVTKKFHSTC